MSYLNHAKAIFDQAVEVRRKIHERPELGFHLPETVKLLQNKLDEFDIAYEMLGDTDGITGLLGKVTSKKTLLLRADMDALAMKEESEHAYSSKNENAHLCGHDMHATALLMALKILKDDEDNLDGQVKFLFQPAEETLNGGTLMIENGILENPRPDAGITYVAKCRPTRN